MPEELLMEVQNIVQEAMIKTIPKKKWKTAKWLSEEALQIVEKRRQAKGKEEKERYIHLNVEFQRISGRDKKAFLSDQWKKIEENKAVYCHPAYLTYIQSTSCEMLDWKKHKLESRLSGEISIISDMQMTAPLWHKVKKN